ncbi:MAG: calcium-binding protein [Nocardioides sp.]
MSTHLREPAVRLSASVLALACLGALLTPGPALGAGPTCFGEEPTITGTGYVEGTDGDDVILADPGSEVHALGGDDLVCGAGLVHAGAGDGRVFYRGPGPDVLLAGGPGADRLFFLSHDVARLAGGPGNDVIRTARGPQYVTGGAGDDDVSLGRGDDYANGRGGRDRIDGGRGDDAASGGEGRDTCTDVERTRTCER